MFNVRRGGLNYTWAYACRDTGQDIGIHCIYVIIIIGVYTYILLYIILIILMHIVLLYQYEILYTYCL